MKVIIFGASGMVGQKFNTADAAPTVVAGAKCPVDDE